MNLEETSALLAKIQSFDNRKVDEAVIISWHEIMAPHSLPDCWAAVRDYYRISDKWIMPSHVIERVREVEKGRINKLRYDLHLNEADHDNNWREKTRALHRAVSTGEITPEQFEQYATGRIELAAILPTVKAITQ